MMNSKLFCGLLLSSVLVLSGCASWFNDGEGLILNPSDDYMDVEERAELEIPEDLRELRDTDPFPIPEVPEPPNPRFFPKRPPLPDAIYANDNRDEVRIQRLGARRWLVIPEPPTTAWPKLKQFLSENGVSLQFDDPGNGRLNTEWLRISDESYRDVVRNLLKDTKAAAGLQRGQDRFLIKVEQGLRALTTEVHVRHENDSLTLPVDDAVAQLDGLNSDVPQAESDFLSEIGAYIAANVSQQTVSRVAQQIGSVKKAELMRDTSGLPLLRLYLDYERAWATLGQALDNAEVEIRNLDRSTGVFFVTIDADLIGTTEQKSFLCRVTFSCGGSNNDHNLQIRMAGENDQTFDVRVLDDAGQQPQDPDLPQQVLVLLREYAT